MYQSAANKGFAIAQHKLAILYDNGRGVSQNYEEAVRLYRLTAEQGFAQSQRNLGDMYDKGQGITADVIRAYMWSSISANGGNTYAAQNRDNLATRMTSEQLENAQKLVTECGERGFRGCV